MTSLFAVRVFCGFDIGESLSGTSACAYFPVTGGLRTWLAFGDVPSLSKRGKRDGSDYLAMQRRGELRTYRGTSVPVDSFVSDVRSDLSGARGPGVCRGPTQECRVGRLLHRGR